MIKMIMKIGMIIREEKYEKDDEHKENGSE